MAHLIYLRRRITTIETIQKITHAMRLVAMSTHSRLKKKENHLMDYISTIKRLFEQIHHAFSAEKESHFALQNTPTSSQNTAIILIGSQKGLCGGFNHTVFSLYEKEIKKRNIDHPTLIIVGKKALEYAENKKNFSVKSSFHNFNIDTASIIAHNIFTTITTLPETCTTILVIHNHLKTFFLQVPEVTQLFPISFAYNPENVQKSYDEYIWEQPPHEIAHHLTQLYITSSLEYSFFQSLLAEQAARFLSMDTATRNAEQLLHDTTLQYNKVRQAKITKELTELSGSFSWH